MAHLFTPFSLRDVTFANRIGVSPMCQYSAFDGLANDWHLVHLGGLARGGAGLVMSEAVAVSAAGRISPQDLGLWNAGQIAPLARIVDFIAGQGSVAGIQLAHAGRKASTHRPWDARRGTIAAEDGGWTTVAPAAVAFSDYATPKALSTDEISAIIADFAAAAIRARQAGFRVVEVHAAHGYLLHQFLSPLSNRRSDDYGGGFGNRIRLTREVVRAVRDVWPASLPLFVRLSATDWTEGGWTLDESVELSRLLKADGADLIDMSSGGLVAHAAIPVGPGYQTAFAADVRYRAGVPVATVGMITSPEQADHIVRSEQADMVLLARELLRQPHWPLHAAEALGQEVPWPPQYVRAAAHGTPIRT